MCQSPLPPTRTGAEQHDGASDNEQDPRDLDEE